jgi:hypothetical protein
VRKKIPSGDQPTARLAPGQQAGTPAGGPRGRAPLAVPAGLPVLTTIIRGGRPRQITCVREQPQHHLQAAAAGAQQRALRWTGG